jgi:hypothetical protein
MKKALNLGYQSLLRLVDLNPIKKNGLVDGNGLRISTPIPSMYGPARAEPSFPTLLASLGRFQDF